MDLKEQGKIITKTNVFLNRFSLGSMPRPYIIEFTGTPESGKTTIINGVDSFFSSYKFRVRRPQEGAEVFRHISRKTPLYNLVTGAYGLQNVAEAASSRDCDVVLLDRALYDACNWMNFWRNEGSLTADEAADFQKIFKNDLVLNNIDLCFYVVCCPEEAMKRAKSDAPTSFVVFEGSWTNKKRIAELITSCEEGYSNMHSCGKPVLWLDTTDMSKGDMFDWVFTAVFKSLKRKTGNAEV